VLEQLLEENDSDPNVWLLLAMCCQGGGDLEGALAAGAPPHRADRRLAAPARRRCLLCDAAHLTAAEALPELPASLPFSDQKFPADRPSLPTATCC
jgi:hypothetical protein